MSLTLSSLLSSKPFIILDGAMGTELSRRGHNTALPLWSAMANVEAPLLVKQIHDDYIAAGADIITTNTFRTTRYAFAKVNKPELAEHVTRLAVELAHESVGEFYSTSPTIPDRRILLAGSIAPLEDCYSPDLVPANDMIQAAYTEQIDLLIQSRVDFILAETMINRAEIVFIASYLKEKGFPFMMSFTTKGGDLLDGTPLEAILPDVIKANPLALLLNCRSCEEITTTLPLLQEHFHGMTGAYAHGPGGPDDLTGWILGQDGLKEYMAEATKWIERGALIVGGCCGTTPEFINAIRSLRSDSFSKE